MKEDSCWVDIKLEQLEFFQCSLYPLEFKCQGILELFIFLWRSLNINILLLRVKTVSDTVKPVQRICLFPLIWRFFSNNVLMQFKITQQSKTVRQTYWKSIISESCSIQILLENLFLWSWNMLDVVDSQGRQYQVKVL